MAVFSEILTDSEIMSIIELHNAHKIFIACCSGCTNESLAYTNRVPIFKSPEGKNLKDALIRGEEVPYASLKEAQRLKTLLETRGYLVELAFSRSGEIFCIRGAGEEFSFKRIISTFSPDMILSLSCPAGVFGLQEELSVVDGKILVVRLMKPLGQMAYEYIDTETERIMIYDGVKICRNN